MLNLCFGSTNWLSLHFVPSSKVGAGTFLGHASHTRAWFSGGFWLWRVSQYYCKHTSCGTGKHSDDSSACTSPTRTITPSHIWRTYQWQGMDVHHTLWYPSFIKSKSLPRLAWSCCLKSTRHPQYHLPNVCMSPEPLSVFLKRSSSEYARHVG